MEYTQNYHLPQWSEDDRIMMQDFNQMCADIESGLDGVKTEAAEERQALNENLRELTDIVNSHKIAMGTYSGNGGTQTIDVGFTPSVVFVCNQRIDITDGHLCGLAVTGGVAYELSGTTTMLTIAANGFKVISGANASLNITGYKYNYIAIC